MTNDQILEMFTKASLIQEFEIYLQKYMQSNNLGMPVYLSLGEEFIPAAVSTVFKNCAIFAQHRCHGWYIAYGGDISALIAELLGKKTGCNAGMSGSASISSKKANMFGHSGLLGDQIPIAVGYAASGNTVLSVAGDAAIEEDYALASLGFAASKKAQVLFLCEDNDLSILTPIDTRRKWHICNVAKSFGIDAIEIQDDPFELMNLINEIRDKLPYYINVKTCRKLWHAGHGCDGAPKWDRYEIVKSKLVNDGFDIYTIENNNKKLIEKLWQEQLQTQ